MNDVGKDRFDAIEIPEGLGKTVHRAAIRGMAARTARKTGAFVCLLVMLTGVAANIPCFYAAAAEIPALGPIVRMMHIGSGGTTGLKVCGATSFDGDTVSVRFTGFSGEPAQVPEFSVIQRNYPRRMVLHFHGIAQMDEQQLLEALRSHPAVEDAYGLIYSEEDEVGVNILLQDSMQCTVTQYADGVLKIGFREGTSAGKDTAYVLCSEPLEPDAAADFCRSLAWEGASQIRTEDGKYQIFLGEFCTLKQAEKAHARILEARKTDLQIKQVHS